MGSRAPAVVVSLLVCGLAAADSVQTVKGACGGAGGFKMATDDVSLWAPNCGYGISRINPAANTLKTVLSGNALAAYSGGALPAFGLGYGGGLLWAAGPCGSSDCVWGINPTTNAIVKAWTLPLPAGDATPLYAYNSLWVASGKTLLRLNPGT